MRIFKLTCVGVVALAALAGCEKRARTRNSAGSSSALFEENAAQTTNVYRFVGVEQSLTDARAAVKAEKWGDAQAAIEALLKQQPGNLEAKQILALASLEGPNLTHFNAFSKAAGAGELGAAVRAYRQISEGSLYLERGRPVFERIAASYLEMQLADARNLNRGGRCDEARRVARVTGDLFPDQRDSLEQAAAGCRPARPQPQHEAVEVAKTVEKTPAAIGEAPAAAAAASEPLAMTADAPRPGLSDATPAPIAPPAPRPLERTLAASVPAAAPARITPPPPPAPEPAPAPRPAPAARPRNIPGAELETLRIAGDKSPSLPAGAKMIARRDKVGKITFAVKLCVSAEGVPTSVTYVKSSDYADANEKILSDIRKWRFRPYIYNGAPVPVCSATLLQYQII
jgi:protein TonB